MKKQILIVISLVMVMGMFKSNLVLAQQWSNGARNDIYKSTIPGNVGIGITLPEHKIHIFDATGTAVIMAESGYNSAKTKTLGGMLIKHSATGDQMFMSMRRFEGTTNEFLLSGYIASQNAWSEFLYFNFTTQKYEIRSGVKDVEFKNSGNTLFNNTGGVGIGVTTIPAGVKFAVNGKVNCKEVEVTMNGWSDHVFNKNYSLMPLSEVEQFILNNKHLPGIPSEKEVLAKGVNLGNMDALLLKKIEELTLYVLELKKENELLKEKIRPIEKLVISVQN
ncbi:MAG: hypothetical protein WCK84_01515 [Bacteroidota bacterium]